MTEAVAETTTTADPVNPPDANPQRASTTPLWIILLVILAGLGLLLRRRDESPNPEDTISYELEKIPR